MDRCIYGMGVWTYRWWRNLWEALPGQPFVPFRFARRHSGGMPKRPDLPEPRLERNKPGKPIKAQAAARDSPDEEARRRKRHVGF